MNKKMKKGLVPELRFPKFRNAGEWKLSPLKKLAISCTEKNRDGNIVRVLTNSAEHGIVDQRDYFDKDIAVQGNLEGYFIVKKGDFVYNPRISSRAPVGPISKNNIATGVMSPLYTVFRFNFENDDYYVHFFKTTGWHHYMRQVSSTGARHDRMAISKRDFIAMPIPTPPFQEEQQKISDCLSSLDELITAHTQKHQALQSYKKGLLQNLFPAEGETVPALRFPEFRNAGEWEYRSVQRLIDEKIILSHLDGNHGSLYPRSEEFTKEGVPYITANDFVSGEVNFSRCKHLPMERAIQFKKGVAKNGDILFAHNATVGPVAKLNMNLKFVILSTTATYFRCDNKILVNDFLKYALSSPNFINQYTRVMSQSTRNQVPITTQRTFNLQIPPSDEQQKVANCLSSVDALIYSQAQKIEELKVHKIGLMQQLFPAADEVGA